jgi:hypothetical protein
VKDTNGLVPEPARPALHRWEAQNCYAVEIVAALDSGSSGAHLLRAYVTGRNGLRKTIIKVCPSYDDIIREPGRHLRALESNVEFAGRRLVGQTFPPIDLPELGPNSWIMFQDVASGSHRQTCTLAEMLGHRRYDHLWALVIESIVSSVLADWNPDPGGRRITAYEFIRTELGPRLDQGARLLQWYRLNQPLLRVSGNTVQPRGEPDELTNPLLLATDPELGGRVETHCILGRRHGDLHGGNVIVRADTDADPTAYWLIDLSRYAEHGPLAVDPVHLTLTAITAALPRLSGRDKSHLIDLLVDPDRASEKAVDRRLRPIVQGMHRAGRSWAIANGRGLLDEWNDQTRLALVTVGLALTGRRRIPDECRLWYFRLAAHAATRLVPPG